LAAGEYKMPKKQHKKNLKKKDLKRKKARSNRVGAYTWGEAMESKNKNWPF
jgi:hypothetical protein